MKTLLRSAARGFLGGVLAHYLFTLGMSIVLHWDTMPPVWLPWESISAAS